VKPWPALERLAAEDIKINISSYLLFLHPASRD
jgi:hypothetical protein